MPPRSCPALLIAAPSSGAGKTSVTAALARFHTRAGRQVRVFKLGPDFLDPLVLQAATGSRVDNVDAWMVGLDESRRLLHDAAGQADLILLEGAMGLFDGDPSPADLAQALGLPVAVVIDASAMAQTFGAVALGMRTYRSGLTFAGVIANRVAGPGHTAMLQASLAADTPLLAAVAASTRTLPERHLGLVPPTEMDDIEDILGSLADAVDWRAATDLPPPVSFDAPPPVAALDPLLAGRTIAVARDAAFCFIYGANIDCLRSLGADIRWFSPLADEPIPPTADAVYLPGGYPELHAATLASNAAWRSDLRRAVAEGLPVWAECGGMMACFDSVVDVHGVEHRGAGLLSGQVKVHPHIQAIGLQSLTLPGISQPLRGHTFHVSTVIGADTAAGNWATAPQGIYGAPEAVHRNGSLVGSYFHGYFPSSPAAAASLFLPQRPAAVRSTQPPC